MVGDEGGKAPAFARSVIGADNVARVLASMFPVLARIDARVEPREVNGQPGAIRDRDCKVVGTLTLDVLGGRIQTVRSVVNHRQARACGSRGGRLGDYPQGEAGLARPRD